MFIRSSSIEDKAEKAFISRSLRGIIAPLHPPLSLSLSSLLLSSLPASVVGFEMITKPTTKEITTAAAINPTIIASFLLFRLLSCEICSEISHTFLFFFDIIIAFNFIVLAYINLLYIRGIKLDTNKFFSRKD